MMLRTAHGATVASRADGRKVILSVKAARRDASASVPLDPMEAVEVAFGLLHSAREVERSHGPTHD